MSGPFAYAVSAMEEVLKAKDHNIRRCDLEAVFTVGVATMLQEARDQGLISLHTANAVEQFVKGDSQYGSGIDRPKG